MKALCRGLATSLLSRQCLKFINSVSSHPWIPIIEHTNFHTALVTSFAQTQSMLNITTARSLSGEGAAEGPGSRQTPRPSPTSSQETQFNALSPRAWPPSSCSLPPTSALSACATRYSSTQRTAPKQHLAGRGRQGSWTPCGRRLCARGRAKCCR